MAYVKKGYIGDSSVSAKLNGGNTKISNGTVYKAYGGVGTGGSNLTANGYPGSIGSYSSGVAGTRTANNGVRSAGGSSSSKSSSNSNAASSYIALLAA